MSQSQTRPIVIHLRGVDSDQVELLQQNIEKRCEHLAQEFHELGRVELNLFGDGVGFEAHAHVTGKGTDIGTHAHATAPRVAADQALDKLEQQLRKAHDKRIYVQRREAQQHPPKRG